MDLQGELLTILIIVFIISDFVFSIVFSFIVFKLVKDKRKRNKMLLHYGFLTFIITLLVVLAIVSHFV